MQRQKSVPEGTRHNPTWQSNDEGLETVIIAIDGPAGSGKSTTSRAVAGRLGFVYLDTGAMYRAIALAFLRSGMPATPEAAENVLADIRLDLMSDADGTKVWLGQEDVTAFLRGPDVTRMSSSVSALPVVRRFLVAEQRRLVDEQSTAGRGVVVEGRDIGTVVFPDAELKVFLTAPPEIRAGRRAEEIRMGGGNVDETAVGEDLKNRDRADSSRPVSPLVPAQDAVTVNTGGLSFDQQVELIVGLARERGN